LEERSERRVLVRVDFGGHAFRIGVEPGLIPHANVLGISDARRAAAWRTGIDGRGRACRKSRAVSICRSRLEHAVEDAQTTRRRSSPARNAATFSALWSRA